MMKSGIILEAIPAGGPYRVETCMKNGTASSFQEALRGDMIHQVYVGDLFVIAGQSNAAGYGKDPVEDGPELGVSLFGQRGIWELASHPLNDSTDSIYEQITERMNPGRSPYLHFAKYYKTQTSHTQNGIRTLKNQYFSPQSILK